MIRARTTTPCPRASLVSPSRLPEEARYLAFYDVHDPAKTVGFDLEHERFRRVVVELEGETPEAAVARISAALAT